MLSEAADPRRLIKRKRPQYRGLKSSYGGFTSTMQSGPKRARSIVTAELATFSTSSLSVGSHSITAAYTGDTHLKTSTSSVHRETIQQALTTTSVSSSLNPAAVDQAVTFTATGHATNSGTGVPTGTVNFKDGNKVLGTGTLAISCRLPSRPAALKRARTRLPRQPRKHQLYDQHFGGMDRDDGVSAGSPTSHCRIVEKSGREVRWIERNRQQSLPARSQTRFARSSHRSRSRFGPGR